MAPPGGTRGNVRAVGTPGCLDEDPVLCFVKSLRAPERLSRTARCCMADRRLARTLPGPSKAKSTSLPRLLPMTPNGTVTRSPPPMAPVATCSLVVDLSPRGRSVTSCKFRQPDTLCAASKLVLIQVSWLALVASSALRFGPGVEREAEQVALPKQSAPASPTCVALLSPATTPSTSPCAYGAA